MQWITRSAIQQAKINSGISKGFYQNPLYGRSSYNPLWHQTGFSVLQLQTSIEVMATCFYLYPG
jgi:hypothetical protein